MSDHLENRVVGLDNPDDPLTLNTIAAVLPRDTEPDWQAAEAAAKLIPNNLDTAARNEWCERTWCDPDDSDSQEDLKWRRESAEKTLATFRAMWERRAGDRYFMVELPDGRALVAFGFDVGNSLDVFDVVRDLQEDGLLEAAGFTNQPEAVTKRWNRPMPYPRWG